MATIYWADGTSEQVEPANKRAGFTAEFIHGVVSGSFEIVRLENGLIMLLNESGKLDGLPLNEAATILFNSPGRAWYDPIAGDVLVCRSQEVK